MSTLLGSASPVAGTRACACGHPEHEHDAIVHPSLLEAQMAELLPRSAIVVQESSTARTTLLPFGYQAMPW